MALFRKTWLWTVRLKKESQKRTNARFFALTGLWPQGYEQGMSVQDNHIIELCRENRT
jgi:ribonuclease I